MSLAPWHQTMWERWQARRAAGTVPHALLLTGAHGLGKRNFVEHLVHGLLCAQPVAGAACGQCAACALMAAQTHPDYVYITFAINPRTHKLRDVISVDQIRDLGQRMSLASQYGGWQVAVIDPADAMNSAAANALLKTLEEPSSNSLLVLVADHAWRLPATIRSRCQRMDFRLPAREQALAWLQQAGVEDAAAALDAAGGNPGLARAWADDGLLAIRGTVRQDMDDLAHAKIGVVALTQRWLDDHLPERLYYAAGWVHREAGSRGQGEAGPLAASRLDGDGLVRWFTHANRVREQLHSTLRPDLALVELLSAWH